MRKILLASLGVLLLLAGLVAFDRSHGSAPEAGSESATAQAAVTTPGPSGGADVPPTRAEASASSTSAAGTAGPPVGNVYSAVPTSAQALSTPGPLLLSADSARSVREFSESVAKRDPRVAAWLAEADAQHRDAAWAEAVEAQLRASVRIQGTKLRSLEVGDPQCWTSVCIIYARSSKLSTEEASSDWQGLVIRVANEPWFPLTFADMNTLVGSDARGMKYATFLIRKK